MSIKLVCNHFNSKMIFCALIALICSLTSCSDDEPDKSVVFTKYPPLQEICGNKAWNATETVYYAGNGETVSTEVIQKYFFTTYTGLCFVVRDNFLTEFQRSYAHNNQWVSLINTYRFDQATGTIYLNNSSTPFAKIESFSADKIVVTARYGSLVTYGMLEGYEQSNTKLDPDSYGRFVLTPADEDLLVELRNTVESFDNRE